MADNTTKIQVRDTESIVSASSGERVVILVDKADVRISEVQSDARNGILVEDKDRATYEMEGSGSLYAYNEGPSKAEVEVNK